jgi:hypothetical protein
MDMTNATALLLKTVLSAFDTDGLAHACAMEIEDNFTQYPYSNVQQFDKLVGDCMNAVLTPPACNSMRSYVSNWQLVEPAYGTVAMSSEQYDLGHGCEVADEIYLCTRDGKLIIECQ